MSLSVCECVIEIQEMDSLGTLGVNCIALCSVCVCVCVTEYVCVSVIECV